jgi:hypothetical protein
MVNHTVELADRSEVESSFLSSLRRWEKRALILSLILGRLFNAWRASLDTLVSHGHVHVGYDVLVVLRIFSILI